MARRLRSRRTSRGQYGIPRATNAVDVNVFVGPERLDDVFSALRSLGVIVDANAARDAADREGLIVLAPRLGSRFNASP